MNIQVDSETRRVTTHCKKKFSCLSGDREALCKVEDCVEGTLRLVHCAEPKKCSYQSPFGSRALCSCPTRKEILSTYGF